MGTSKTDYFSRKLNRTASLCHALAHPARVAILELLIRKNKLIANSIANELPLAQATIAQHLKTLVVSGILEIEKEESNVFYVIDKESIEKLSSSINRMKEQLNGK